MRNHILFITTVCFVLFPFNSIAQNLVPNGDFEEDFNYWSTAGNVSIAHNFAYSGVKSFKVSTAESEYGFIYQRFTTPFVAFDATFWVYPLNQNYHTAFELIANWTPSNYLEDKYIVRFIFAQDTINLRALDKDTTITNRLETNYWNKAQVKTDPSGLTKYFYINDQFVGKLTSAAVFQVENIFIGDVSTRGSFGTVFYDNVSVIEMNHFHVEVPNYITSPFDIMVCGSTLPQRSLSFDLSAYQHITSLKLVYAYVNFDRIGGQYPPINPGDISFSVTMGETIIDQVLGATNSYRIKREIDLLPYWNNSSLIEINFTYQSGNNFVEIVRPVIFLSDTTSAQITNKFIAPIEVTLYQNYPNPFSGQGGSSSGGNPATVINYEIAEAGDVVIAIFNMLGQKIRSLVTGYHQPGKYSATWDGTDDSGEKLTSGVYYYQLRSNQKADVKRMTLLK